MATRKLRGTKQTVTICCAIPETPTDLSASKDWRELVLVGDGETKMNDGSRIVVDSESAAETIKEILRKGVDIPIDTDHATLYGPMRGFRAPAVGWIDRTTVKYAPGRGLVASVRWNDDGANLLHSRSYRYGSPVAAIDKHSGRIKGFHSYALTNKPLTLDAQALKAASEQFLGAADMPAENPQPDGTENTGVDLLMLVGRIIERMELDVPPDAPIETVLQAIYESLKGGGGDGESSKEATAAASELKTLFGLKPDAGFADIVNAAKTAGDKLVIGAEGMATMRKELDEIKAAEHTRQVDAVLAGFTGNKINPNNTEQMKRCRDLAARDIKAFSEFMAGQPDVMPQAGQMIGGDVPPKERDRATLIAASERDFDAGGTKGRLTDKVTFVAGALIEAGLPTLSDEERKAYPQ